MIEISFMEAKSSDRLNFFQTTGAAGNLMAEKLSEIVKVGDRPHFCQIIFLPEYRRMKRDRPLAEIW